MAKLPPPPAYAKPGDFAWEDWYRQVQNFLGAQGLLGWESIDTSGSDLTDISNRDHNVLTTIQGGTTSQYYHLTSTEHTNLTPLSGNIAWDAGNTELDVTGSVNMTAELLRGGTQVVTARQTGWGAPTGTATRTTYATFAGQTITNPPTQAEVQAIDNAVVILSERLKALIDDLTTHGLIGT